MQWKRIDMHCVFADYVCVSKYLCYDTGLYIIFKCNLRARTKNTTTRADEHMLNFKLIRNDYNCFMD